MKICNAIVMLKGYKIDVYFPEHKLTSEINKRNHNIIEKMNMERN